MPRVKSMCVTRGIVMPCVSVTIRYVDFDLVPRYVFLFQFST